MKALCWHGKEDVRVERVPDPSLSEPGDIIVKVTSTAICGSDLHLYDGYIPTMRQGDILGHEFMGEVVETGRDVKKLKVGDRVIVPFTIACGGCFFCNRQLWSLCDNSNPNAGLAESLFGKSPSGLFGYSHLMGGFSGGQAEYVRVPYADVGPMKIPHVRDGGPEDEKVLFLTDIFPTGWMAAENCDIQDGDVVAVWGCGPVGQFAIRSAQLLGAAKVIGIDRVPERLRLAAEAGAETIDFDRDDVRSRLDELTGGRGPDSCIDAVGIEAHGLGSVDAVLDRAKAAVGLATDRGHALRQAILACRKGGTISIPGVYGGVLDKVPFGAAFNKGLSFRMGQTHMMRYMRPLFERVEKGEIDPSFVITHRLRLDDGPDAYRTFRDKQDGCIKVVMQPGA